jgi:hypothetical protein
MPTAEQTIGETRPQQLATSRDPWQIVLHHKPYIMRAVKHAINSGYLSHDDRNDAITECEITAYELALRRDVENYQHLLSRTLKLNLFRKNTRTTTDAMDHATALGEKDGMIPNNAESDIHADKPAPDLDNIARPEAEPPLDPEVVEHLIRTRVPPNRRVLAHMAFVQRRTVARIANSTGRTRYDVKLRLFECHKLMWGRKIAKSRR